MPKSDKKDLKRNYVIQENLEMSWEQLKEMITLECFLLMYWILTTGDGGKLLKLLNTKRKQWYLYSL